MPREPSVSRTPKSHESGVHERPGGGVPLVAASAAMRDTLDQARRFAPSHVPVVIQGETGAGKEVVAQYIHRQSGRRWEPMVCLNCAAIAPTLLSSTLFGHERGAFTGAEARRAGVFEGADGGTLFLDEVAELSAEAQASLLRVLETGRVRRVGASTEIPVDVRVVAATHRDLRALCAERRFREDLLFRLEVVSIRVPPLRERPEDVLPLARQFLRGPSRVSGRPRDIAPDAERALLAYHWPGNVRELRNAMERATVMASSQCVTPGDLPALLRRAQPQEGGRSLPERLRELEREIIRDALERCGGNRVCAAKELGIPRRTLFYKLRRLGLTGTDEPAPSGG